MGLTLDRSCVDEKRFSRYPQNWRYPEPFGRQDIPPLRRERRGVAGDCFEARSRPTGPSSGKDWEVCTSKGGLGERRGWTEVR